MPFWESENVGWKIWFANSVDVYAKKKPLLMSQHLYMDNYDGYGVSQINPDWGSDIQSVAETMSGGAIGIYENPDKPTVISLPRFTPTKESLVPQSLWNAGQISDTRYAYEEIVNGPLRSIVKIKTMNWNSGNGSYEIEQYYTAYAKQSYTTCRVKYIKFLPKALGFSMACGIRKKPQTETIYQQGGIVISSGLENIKDPENIDERQKWFMPIIGKTIVVKDKYEPKYQYTANSGGNHTLKVTPDFENKFEYMLFAAWSDGAVFNNQKDFENYVVKTAFEFNNPIEIKFVERNNKN